MKLHLGWDQVLVGQQLQLPHPAPLHQLEGDVLRVQAHPAQDVIDTVFKQQKGYRKLHNVSLQPMRIICASVKD